MSRLLTPLAVALAGITATSVGMAVHKLIADPVLAGMFSGAAVLLDVFKYAAWPAAAGMVAQGRKALSVGLITCAVVFAGVSGWATYDRVVGAIEGRSASSEQRLADLAQQRLASERRVAELDGQLAESRQQAAWMRERGMATKSQELEEGAVARADKERSVALGALEAASQESQRIIAERGTPLPALAILMLGLGFALALEVVPVLIFLVGARPARKEELPIAQPATQEPVFMGNLAAPEPVNTGEPPVVSGEPSKAAPPTQASPTPATGRDEELLQALLAQGSNLMKVKDFAKANGIGNTRASAVYKAAEAAGRITKTPTGYVVAKEHA